MKELTPSNFEEVTHTPGLVIIFFCSPMSGNCESYFPTLNEAAANNPTVLFVTCNFDAQAEVDHLIEIASAPAIAIFRDGCFIFKQEGAPDGAGMQELINGAMSLDMDAVRRELETA